MADFSTTVKGSAKVVPIDSAYLHAKMPAVFVDLKDRAQKSCMPLLQALFDHVDDALFEMADKADSNAAQNMYFESMREVRLKRRGMELSFLKSIDAAFYKISVPTNEHVPSETVEIAPSELAIVASDELEELMASSALVAKAEQNFIQPLALLIARLNELLETNPVNADSNPLGPSVICKAFVDACQALETDINTKLVLFKLFDRYVVDSLATVYTSCNDYLAESGILSEANASTLLQGASSHEAATTQSNSSDVAEVFANLQALLQAAPHAQTQQAAGLQAAGAAPQIPHDSLMALLQLVQQQAAQSNAIASAQALDIQQALNTLCLQRLPGQALSIGQVEDDTINLVSMLFQFVLEDRNLAEPIKALLSRMQIPIVRIAMEDKSFFSRGGHPARKLLNAMATAALGWEEPEQLERDSLYKKMSAVVEHLLDNRDSCPEVFEDILSDFTGFLELERRRASLIEQRTLDAEDGKAKAELARESVKQFLDEKLSDNALPQVVISLLRDAWSNVLFLLSLKEGEHSPEWNEAVQVVDDLLWSVAPITCVADRKRLLQLIPSLLNSLRKGLTQVAFNPFEMNQLFDDLENIHLNQLRQPAEVAPSSKAIQSEPMLEENELVLSATDEPLASSASAGAQTLDQLLEGRDKPTQNEQLEDGAATEVNDLMAELDSLEDLEGFGLESVEAQGVAELPTISTAEPDIGEHRIDQLAVGSWLDMIQEDGSNLRCRLAAIIRGTGKYIFVNRAGMKVAEHSRYSLAQAVDVGEVTLLDDGLLFDRALESVIGNLRQMKAQGSS